MTESKGNTDKTLSVQGRKPLSLKRSVDAGTVRQNFSHGRSKAVVVEKKRKRVVAPKAEAEPKPSKAAAGAPAPAAPAAKEQPAAAEAKPAAPEAKAPAEAKPAAKPKAETAKTKAAPKRGEGAGGKGRSGVVLRTLTDEEQKKRAAALSQAKVYEEEERARAQADAKRRAEEEKRLAAERAEAERRQAEEETRKAVELEAKRKAEDEARKRLEAEEAAKKSAAAEAPGDRAKPAPGRGRPSSEQELLERARRQKEADAKTTARRTEPRRRSGKLTITQALDGDAQERTRSLAAVKRAREREKRRLTGEQDGEPKQVVREVVIPEILTVQELANRMAVRAVDVIKTLMKQGTMATINDPIDADTAQLIAEEYGHSVKRVSEADVEEGLGGEEDTDEHQVPRAPVVTVMGHVDHGKTSLLDALRATDVVSGEAGGITQHIGAYQVTLESGQKISFLDTPGHAAFTSMRARGAKVTDIVVLVVAADDGVMPQTIEAINHAKAAEVPIIVAINKMDKEEANPDRVRQDLLRHELIVESLGGDIQDIPVSALKREGLDKLEEAILLQSEIMELKANPDRTADGVVIEAKLDRGRGPVATVLVQRGTLRTGDILVAGAEWGRVRALIDDHGNPTDEAGPTVPVEVLGMQGTPEAGDHFAVVENEARAREISDYRQRKLREAKSGGSIGRGSLEQMLAQLKDTEKKEFPILIKSDVQGSAEAIVGALDQLSTDEVAARPIHVAVGGITESDVTLAKASEAPILAFNVRANSQARDLAQREGVEIRYYSVIYNLIDDVKGAMSGLLDPTIRETFLGYAEILDVFNISKIGRVAGCRITEGVVRRGNKVRLLRDDVVIHEGTLATLKRFKDEVKEVNSGQECGMAFENYQDIQKGDRIECFEVEEVARTLD